MGPPTTGLASHWRRIELVEHDRATGWLVPRAVQLAQKWGATVAVDPGGPAGSFIPDLKMAGIEVVEVGGADLTKACGRFFDSVSERKVQIRTDARLDTAMAGAAKRPSGDAWVWTRKNSSSDISALVAVTIALWAVGQAGGPSAYISLSEVI